MRNNLVDTKRLALINVMGLLVPVVYAFKRPSEAAVGRVLTTEQ